MQVKQVYELVNSATTQALGKSDLLKEDLSNVIDVGTEIFNANAYDNYVRALVDRIGKTIFVDRKYDGNVPSVLMDGWEYRSVVEKISMELPEAEENDSWSLTDGEFVNQDVFKAPVVSVKFFNNKVTFEVDISITEEQVKESFQNAPQLERFVAMIFTHVRNSIRLKTESLIRRTINNYIAELIYNSKAINILAKYNTDRGESLTVATCMRDKEFLRYVSQELLMIAKHMGDYSSLFNLGGKARFTPKDMLHIVLHEELDSGARIYLYGDTFHKEDVKLPVAETVSYWQGTGTDYEFENTSKINVQTASGHSVEQTGIIAFMFDRDALGVCNKNSRVPTHVNGKGEFTNYFFKEDAHYFNDFNENAVVLYVADE